MSHPYVRPDHIHTMLLNHPPDVVEAHLKEHLKGAELEAAYVPFHTCVAVHLNHLDDIRDGTPFMKLYNEYLPIIMQAKMEDKEIDLPSLKAQASGLLSSITKVIRSGGEKVEDKEYQHRLDTCASCEFLWPGMEDKLRCRKCGCFMRNKAKYEVLHCPVGKW